MFNLPIICHKSYQKRVIELDSFYYQSSENNCLFFFFAKLLDLSTFTERPQTNLGDRSSYPQANYASRSCEFKQIRSWRNLTALKFFMRIQKTRQKFVLTKFDIWFCRDNSCLFFRYFGEDRMVPLTRSLRKSYWKLHILGWTGWCRTALHRMMWDGPAKTRPAQLHVLRTICRDIGRDSWWKFPSGVLVGNFFVNIGL